MYILGVFNAHNSGVTLLKDSQIIYASAEERFTREKFTRTFPEESIKNCLEFCGIKYDDIDIEDRNKLNLLAYSDGKRNIFNICEKINQSLEQILFNIKKFKRLKLLKTKYL